MESCRRIVAGRWQRALPGPGGEGIRYIQHGLVSPPFQGGVARSAGVVLAPITTPPPPAAPLLDEEGINPNQPCPAASPSSKTTPQSAPTTPTRSGNTATR